MFDYDSKKSINFTSVLIEKDEKIMNMTECDSFYCIDAKMAGNERIEVRGVNEGGGKRVQLQMKRS